MAATPPLGPLACRCGLISHVNDCDGRKHSLDPWRIYCVLTTPVHHRVIKTRDEKGAVIMGLHKHHGLLAAFLEATDKIDWRALQKRVPIGEMPEPANVETLQAAIAAELPQVTPAESPVSAFALRRANLVRAPE